MIAMFVCNQNKVRGSVGRILFGFSGRIHKYCESTLPHHKTRMLNGYKFRLLFRFVLSSCSKSANNKDKHYKDLYRVFHKLH